jgi:hypothetical protein
MIVLLIAFPTPLIVAVPASVRFSRFASNP